MAKKLLIANWKENPKTERQALALFDATAKLPHSKDLQVVVCPPNIYLEKIVERPMRNVAALGAQDVSMEESGAHTGEVGPKMLKKLGVTYVIVGHSERRAFGETDGVVNKKLRKSIADGMRVILCVGETAGMHRQGDDAVKKFIKAQLQTAFVGVKNIKNNLVVAYEPIWAIGTGNNADPAYVQEMSLFIKKEIKRNLPSSRAPLLYGGSVNSKNILDYVQCKEIDGALIGGASLKAGDVKKMIGMVSKKLFKK